MRLMPLDQKSNLLDDLEKRFQTYLFFSQYYAGKADPPILSWFYHEMDSFLGEHPLIIQGLDLLHEVQGEDSTAFRYDFNRLFVGPGKLLAPPYESAYLNQDGLVMQEETLSVRKYYRTAGLEISALGREPDDHIVFQLEFICYLLSQEAQALNGVEDDHINYLELYRKFFAEHLMIWVPKHTRDVQVHSQTSACKAMGLLLEGFLETEKQALN